MSYNSLQSRLSKIVIFVLKYVVITYGFFLIFGVSLKQYRLHQRKNAVNNEEYLKIPMLYAKSYVSEMKDKKKSYEIYNEFPEYLRIFVRPAYLGFVHGYKMNEELDEE